MGDKKRIPPWRPAEHDDYITSLQSDGWVEVAEMSSEIAADRRKRMEILRWATFSGDIVVATVFVLFAESMGDLAYYIAAFIVLTGIAYFALWHRIFRSAYSDKL